MLFLSTALLLASVLLAGFFIAQFYNIAFRGYAPIVSTQREVISKVIQELGTLGVKAGAKIFELGSGFAGFSSAAAAEFSDVGITGVEYSFLPYFISRLQLALKKSPVKIIRGDILKIDLKDADIIYCFLSIRLMELLDEKFKKELKPGSVVISYQFPLPHIKPLNTIRDERKHETIFFYKF
jgi:hypothetical protein